jgi:CotH kinase protein
MRPAALLPCLLALCCACASDAPGGAAPGATGWDDDALSPAPSLCRVELQCAAPIVDEPKTDCTLRVADGAGAIVYDSHVAIERRGRSSQAYPKPNYGLELRDAAGAELPTNLLGMGSESDWILDGSWIDRSFVRNELVFGLFRSLDPARWAPRGRFCELWLNSQEQGIYRLGERIERDDDRLDIPEDDGSGQSLVMKQDSDGQLHWDVGEERRWKLVSPRQERATATQLEVAQQFLDALDAALRAGDALSLLELDALVDFVIMQELAKSADAYNLSLHLWKAPGALAQLVPWDFDLSIGQPASSIRPGQELATGWVLHRTSFSDGWDRLPVFRARLVERWRAHRQGPLDEAAILARIDRALQTLTPAALEANFQRWPLADVDFRQIYEPYTLYRVDSHAEELARVQAWLRERLAWIDAHIEHYPD